MKNPRVSIKKKYNINDYFGKSVKMDICAIDNEGVFFIGINMLKDWDKFDFVNMCRSFEKENNVEILEFRIINIEFID